MRKRQSKDAWLYVTSLPGLFAGGTFALYSGPRRQGRPCSEKETRERALAAGRQIRVNAIAPGAVPGGGILTADVGSLEAMIHFGGLGTTPDDLGALALALAVSARFSRT